MRWDLFAVLMLLPWAATFGGSLMAARIGLGSAKRQGALLGFAAGIMIAASVWSLIVPAFSDAGHDFKGTLVVTLGFLLGCAGMLGLDKLVPHQHMDEESPEGSPSHLSRPMLLVLAVALHNIPEGLALGVVIAAAMADAGMTWTAAIVFGLGLALQNFPEGAAVSMPLRREGAGRLRSFLLGQASGLVEPVAGVLGALLVGTVEAILPYALAFAAGAMILVAVHELIPECQRNREARPYTATMGIVAGFAIMMLLDVALG